jgi:hypothetical protein
MDIKEQAQSTENDISRDINNSAESFGDKEAQDGVKQVEAVTLVWTRKSLILAYAL